MTIDSKFVFIFDSPYGTLALRADEVSAAAQLARSIAPVSREKLQDGDQALEDGRLLDATELGDQFGIKPSWLLQRAREGRIPHVRIGKYVRFDPAEIRDYFHREGDRHAN